MSIEITTEVLERRTSFLLGLSSDDVLERRKGIGASDANIILAGDPEKIMHLWRVKRGEEEPEDLSDVLQVQLGTWTEAFNIYWFERQTGLIATDRLQKVPHPKHTFIVARPEGFVALPDGRKAVLECKHVSPFNYDIDATIARYRPQLAVQMACTGADCAAISVLSGNSKWEYKIVERDTLYEVEVLNELVKFWNHVQTGTWPTDISSPEAPIPVALMRKEDFSTRNEWVSLESDYVLNEAAAKIFDTAKKGLKELIADDVGEVKGKLLKAKRSKIGAISFSRLKGV